MMNITSNNTKPQQTAFSLHLKGEYIGNGNTQLKLSRAIKRKGNFTAARGILHHKSFYILEDISSNGK